ncbi:hypothetical protein TorRG33x02_119350 [Trema orientale]|uniref:Uncharacterized protein n=1 Tax=Trema orientale TaxID=63057 RepID=A0A2P5F3E0_TREOI|nr:hypothetical protein TorRG33x02_119350 [Trema orientale]
MSTKVILLGNLGGSLRTMASSISMGKWVATITIPPLFLCSEIMYSSSLTPSSSKATEGSSSSQMGLSMASSLASWSLFLCPIESIFAFSFANRPSPISSSAGSDLSPGLPSRTSNHWTLSRTVRLVLMASLRESQLSWSLYWWKTPDSVMSWPFQRTSPPEGRENPASMRRKVVLPDPFAPVRTREPPSWRVTFTFRRICWAFRMHETFLRTRRGSWGFLRDIISLLGCVFVGVR